MIGWRRSIRHAERRIRRRLGLPALSRGTALVLILIFLGLAYLSVTLFADFVMTLGQYAPQYYEPKDFAREDFRRK